jgi:multidrug efflux system membrane fusion protein
MPRNSLHSNVPHCTISTRPLAWALLPCLHRQGTPMGFTALTNRFRSSSGRAVFQTSGGFASLLALLALGVLPGCDPSQAQGGPPMAPPVSVAPAVKRSVQESDEFTGRLEATETVDIRARVGGTLEKIHFTEGQLVTKGQLLYTLDARAYWAEVARAKAQLNAARTAAELAGTEETRAQKLLAEKAISQQESEQLGASSRNAKANVQAAQAAVQVATLNVDHSQIRAPITGVASRTLVTVGNLVAPGEQVLTTLVSQDKVYAYFDVPEQTYLRYAQASGNDRKPPVQMGLANETGYPHAGQIDFFDNRLNPATGGIRARAVFDNTKLHLIPGLFARLKLTSGTLGEAVLVAERAIGTDQSKRFVWVVGDDKMPQFRQVTLGSLNDGMRVVTQGLKAGELVVVSGLQRVRPGAPLSPEVLQVDEQGRPIEKPPAPAGGAPAAKGAAPGASAPASAPAKP